MRSAPKRGWGLLSPILALQSRHTIELATIAGDDDTREAARVAGDQKIVPPDRSTPALERRANVRCVMRRGGVERQDLKPGGGGLNFPAVGVGTS